MHHKIVIDYYLETISGAHECIEMENKYNLQVQFHMAEEEQNGVSFRPNNCLCE